MEGSEWKIGETYIVRALHGKAFSEDSFFIDERHPVVQSDKSVYIWGSNMILTVIDPDADKNSALVEFVGDRLDSKLLISSSKGNLLNYRLRETGDSTGIFQGIIGFIGVEDNGNEVGYEHEGKLITQTQGHGVDDGFVAVSEYEEMIITYTNGAGSASITVFVIKDFKSAEKHIQKRTKS